nr:glutathione S-transferase family protein [uncultured Shimia sp.]
MDGKLRLHYAPDNASLIVRLALEELQLPYETVLVDRAKDAQNSASYLAINPAGLIPAMETPDGPLFETAAILLWVCETQDALGPQPGHPERGAFLKWMFYVSNTAHTNLRLNFYAEKYVGSDRDKQVALRKGARQNLTRSFNLLDELLREGHDWFGGDHVGALDLYICAMLRWSALYPQGDTQWFDLQAFPDLQGLAQRIEVRDSVLALCKAEGMAPRPFSKPDYPNPPEGVAI